MLLGFFFLFLLTTCLDAPVITLCLIDFHRVLVAGLLRALC